MSQAFPASARLHRPAEYAAVLRRRRLARGKWLAVFCSAPVAHEGNGAAGQPAGARLGLIIPKRLLPLAVSRNAVKRVLRETFRRQRHALPPVDIVFRVVSAPAPMSLTALRREIRQEAEQLLKKVAACG